MAASFRRNCLQLSTFTFVRRYATESKGSIKKGLVLGAYHSDKGENIKLSPTAQKFDDSLSGKLKELIEIAGVKKGKARVFYNLSPEFKAVSVVGLGDGGLGYNELEEIDEGKETVRAAAAVGCRSLENVTDVFVEDLGDAEAAAEGATLGVWKYQENKNKEKQTKIPAVHFYSNGNENKNWANGVIKAEAQNLARRLTDTPANLMTPTIFAQNAQEALSSLGVDVKVHDKAWAQQQKMGSFLSVSHGSVQPPLFLEMSYNGGAKDDNPVVFVGKGITFDSGGISLKKSEGMDEMRGDMGGAACVVATLQAIAKLKLPINVVGLIPLCENMPSGSATKPGDVVKAMNGKSIMINNTDAEGRLILADGLCYAAQFKPKFTLDIATLTGAMRIALGGAAVGVFSNSTPLWDEIRKAGEITGDRVWRFPLWNHYTKRVTDFPSIDVCNIAKGNGGGACTAAAFLKEFAPEGSWLHLDIAGVAGIFGPDDLPYLYKGMSGRPTRTLIQLLAQYSTK